MVDDPLDRALLLQMPDSNARKAPVDLQPLDEDALADEAEGGDFLQDTVVGGLVNHDGVLRLVLDLSLRPLLLLGGLAAARWWGRCFGFGLDRICVGHQHRISEMLSQPEAGHPSLQCA